MKKRERLPSKPIPIARSVSWKPLDDSYHVLASMLGQSSVDNYVLLATQEFLTAVQGVPEPGADPQPGLMLGRLYRCPKSELRYGIIDGTAPLPAGVFDDRGRVDAQRMRQLIQEAKAGDGRVLGWYAARGDVGPRLAAPDERVQAECFPESWQAALVVVPAVGYSAGGFFRYSVQAQRTCQVPFYEVLEGGAPKRGEPKRTVIEWCNYVTPEAVLRPDVAADAAAKPSRSNGSSKLNPFGGILGRVREWVGSDRAGQ